MRHTLFLPVTITVLLAAPTFGNTFPGLAYDTRALPDEAVAAAYTPPKSVGAAYLWALGATIVPITAGVLMPEGYAGSSLIAAGIFLGPSAGQFYAESYGTGLAGVGIRVAAIPAGLLVGSIFASNSSGEGFDDLASFLGGMILGGGLVLIAGTTYSVLETPFAVRRANARAERRYRASVMPTLLPVDDGRVVTRWAPGMALRVGF